MTGTWLAWALLAVQTVLMAAFVGFSEHARVAIERSGLAADISTAVTILAFPAVGVLILTRRPGHHVGWLFCFANLGWSVVNAAGAYARDAVVAHPGWLPAADVAVWLYGWPGPLSIAAIVLLLLVFPDGSFLSARWRALGRAAVVLAVSGSFAAAFAPGPTGETIGFPVDNPFAIQGAVGDVLRVAAVLGSVLLVNLPVAGAFALVRRYRVTGDVQRHQIKWFAYAAATVATFAILQMATAVYFSLSSTAPGWVAGLGTVAISSAILLPLAAAVAILRYRLYDIDVFIRRTLIYAAVSVTLAATYFAGVLLLQTALRPLIGGSEVPVALSTLAVVALFAPLRRRIQQVVDRRFYRSRYDAAHTLDAFSARLRDEVDLDAVRADLIDAVHQTVRPAHASVWLREATR